MSVFEESQTLNAESDNDSYLPDLVSDSSTDEDIDIEEAADMVKSIVISTPEETKEKPPEMSEAMKEHMEKHPGGVVVQPKSPLDHLPFYKSLKYLSEESKFGRTSNGDVTYQNRILCRYVSTARGCKQGDQCRFLHKPIPGCVFNQMAIQGCVYTPSDACPFSHDPDAVVVAPSLRQCKNFEVCGNSCMFEGSTCLRCFNKTSRQRRDRVRAQQTARREEFTPQNILRPPSHEAFQGLYQPVETTRSYFTPGYMPIPHVMAPGVWPESMPPPPHPRMMVYPPMRPPYYHT